MTLHYTFPWIANIDQVLPVIEGKKEFVVVEKDGYTVVNYVVQESHTFPPIDPNGTTHENWVNSVLRECRGMIFDNVTGRILSRRLHKFFNHGEKPDITVLDLDKPHFTMEKLDGSMITPIWLDGHCRWGTKMGITDLAMRVETWIMQQRVKSSPHGDYEGLAFECASLNMTPIFEWLSADREDQIVVQHKEANLVLLHIRNNVTGDYVSRNTIRVFGEAYNVPVVKHTEAPLTNVDEFIEYLRTQEGTEGVVIMWEDGHMVKVKTDWYAALHRAKAAIEKERDVCFLVLDNQIDDFLPLHPPETIDRLMKYRDEVWQDIHQIACTAGYFLKRRGTVYETRKDFALATTDIDHAVRSCVFALYDQPVVGYDEILEWVINMLKRACVGNDAFDKRARPVLKTAKWNWKGDING